MEISHIAHSCFKLRGSKATVITDPYDPEMLGVKFPKIPADIVTLSHLHPDHNYLDGIEDNPLVIQGPGEYEIKGINIRGVATYHDEVDGKERGKNTVFRFDFDGITLVHCGDLGHKLSDIQVELLNGVDVLLIPVGEVYTLPLKLVLEVINALEPTVIIPMHYHTASLDQNKFGKLLGVDTFLKEMGKPGSEPVSKFNISKDKKPLETTIVVLE